jgi:hypothetical protein
MKTEFQNAQQAEKTASDLADRMRSALGTVISATSRERLAKLSDDQALANAQRDSDKDSQTLETAQQVLTENKVKPGHLYVDGTGTPIPAMGAEQKMAEAFETAAALQLLSHVKAAAQYPALMAKTACPVCRDGRGCGACNNLGVTTKFAAEQFISQVDAISDRQAATAIAKWARDSVAGKDEAKVAELIPDASAAMGVMDEGDMSMHPSEPPPQTFGQLHVRYNPLINFLDPTAE